jgi:methyl-accepting chemotaxis protein
MPMPMQTVFASFAAVILLFASAVVAVSADSPAPTGQRPAAPDAAGDVTRKAEIMNGQRWRRAIFELSEWLSSQQIYSPQEVNRIKADFNRRVAGMSSYELEYLLDDLDAKFKILETPEAKDARAWVGQYLAVMSDSKRAEVLKDVPDVVTMSAAQLQQEVDRIEQTKASLQQRQQAFDQSRQTMVDQAAAARQATAAASRAAMAQTRAAPFSPYHSGGGGGGGGGGGKQPFSDVHQSGMTITAGPFGAYASFNTGAF